MTRHASCDRVARCVFGFAGLPKCSRDTFARACRAEPSSGRPRAHEPPHETASRAARRHAKSRLQPFKRTALAERVATTLDARPDPHTDGILAFAPDPGDPRAYGRVLRFTPAGMEVVADGVSRFHRVAEDGRVVYIDHGEPSSFFEDADVRLRNPDGGDRLIAADATLNDSLRFYATPLDGDILYDVRSGPDRGLWRMPFDTTQD